MTHLRQTSRPLRIAIDVSIWLVRVQAGRGGVNPEVRTLFFRLLKLLALPVHPLFVFDGAHKPPFKRGKAVGNGGSGSVPSVRLSKRLIDLFSFPRHTAPGEAEAECARLQVAGVVDAVMSDDVDAIMFGSKNTIMNFSRENSRRTDAATHVNLYRTDEDQSSQRSNVSLDRSGMILFAMLSGGDYLPSGVPKCGHKTAGEIARAGFGSSLIDAIKGQGSTEAKLAEWRGRVQHELNENESGLFQRKHKSIKIPDTFPDKMVLSYYTDPVVSTAEEIEKLRQSIKWDQDIDVPRLQQFVDNTLGWSSLPGLKRFIKVFSAPLVSYRLRLNIPVLGYGQTAMANKDLHSMEKVYRERAVYANDGIPELQFEFVPGDVVGLELGNEINSSSQQQPIQETLIDQDIDPESDPAERPTSSKREPKEYDPFIPEKIWIFESVAEIGAPEAVAAWRVEQERKETALNEAKAKKAERAAARAKKKKPLDSGMKEGDIFRYASRTKPGAQRAQSHNRASSPDNTLPSPLRTSVQLSPQSSRKSPSKSSKPGAKPSTRKKKTPGLPHPPKIDNSVNPFTIAKSQARPRGNMPSSYDSELGIGEQVAFYSGLSPSPKDRSVDHDPFLPGSSPPPLPPTPISSSRNESATAGTTTDPITISSSPLHPSTVPSGDSSYLNQTPTEAQVSPSKHLPEPQTPPISTELLSDDFPFPSPTNIHTPTPKPKAKKPLDAEQPLPPPQPRELFESSKECNEDDRNQTSDPFISHPSPTNIPASSPPLTSSNHPTSPVETQTQTNPPPPLEKSKKSAYLVNSYDGYWTCKKHEAPDTDTDILESQDSDAAGSNNYGGHKGKKKSPRKKYGRVSILDLT